MRRLLISLFFTLISFNAASNEKITFEAYMIEYLEVTNSISNTKMMLDNMLNIQKQNLINGPEKLDKHKVNIIAEVIKTHYYENYVTQEYLLNLNTPVYRKHFSLEDMKKIIEFYRTPVGKKLILNQGAIQAEVMVTMQTDLQNGTAELQAKIAERLESEQ